eukprot:6180683-Pleurochrysis_carterae.AAC.2
MVWIRNLHYLNKSAGTAVARVALSCWSGGKASWADINIDSQLRLLLLHCAGAFSTESQAVRASSSQHSQMME